MNTENRDYTIPIRVSFSEREKIKSRADSVKRNVSTFMRQTALNKGKARKELNNCTHKGIKGCRKSNKKYWKNSL